MLSARAELGETRSREIGRVDTLAQTPLTRPQALAAIAALAGMVKSVLASEPVLAQDAPAISEPVWEVLGSLPTSLVAPGLTLDLARFTWMPGYAQEIHTHNGGDVVYVLSGTAAWRVEGGDAQVYRATVAGTPVPTETLVDGAEVVLEAGNAIAFDYGYQQLWHAGRAIGAAPVVMLFANLYDPTKPITVYAEDVGTPEP